METLKYMGSEIKPEKCNSTNLNISIINNIIYVKQITPTAKRSDNILVYYQGNKTIIIHSNYGHEQTIYTLSKLIHPETINYKNSFTTNYLYETKTIGLKKDWHKFTICGNNSLMVDPDNKPTETQLKKLEIIGKIANDNRNKKEIVIPKLTLKKAEEPKIKSPQKVKLKLPLRRLK